MTLWTVARQALLSTGFPRQEHRSGLPFPPLGDLPNPGIEPRSLALQVDFLPAELPGKPIKFLLLAKRVLGGGSKAMNKTDKCPVHVDLTV